MKGDHWASSKSSRCWPCGRSAITLTRCRCSSSSRRPPAARLDRAVYAALARLEDKGFVRSEMGDATARRGGKSKRLYEVTPLGLRTARELHRVREKIWTAIVETGTHESRDPAGVRRAYCCGFCPLGDRRAEVEADLLELSSLRARNHGDRYARRRYYGDVLSLWRRSACERSSPPSRRRQRARRRRARSHLRGASAAAQPRCRDGHRPGARPGHRGQHRRVQPAERRGLPADRHRRSVVGGPSDARLSRTGSGTRGGTPTTCGCATARASVRLEASLRGAASVGRRPGSDVPDTAGLTVRERRLPAALNNRASLGRVLTPADDAPGAPPVVVVSHGWWSRTAWRRPVDRRSTDLVERDAVHRSSA